MLRPPKNKRQSYRNSLKILSLPRLTACGSPAETPHTALPVRPPDQKSPRNESVPLPVPCSLSFSCKQIPTDTHCISQQPAALCLPLFSLLYSTNLASRFYCTPKRKVCMHLFSRKQGICFSLLLSSVSKISDYICAWQVLEITSICCSFVRSINLTA